MDILFPEPESGFVRSMLARRTNKCKYCLISVSSEPN